MDGTTRENRVLPKGALVTGGAGFLGSHLCARLLDDGYQVVALDNLVTGSMRNLDPMRGNSAFKFVRHDVIDQFKYRSDRIFNLACCASPVHYQCDPEKTMRTCLDGARHVLRLAQESNAKVFQASTSEVYGEPECHPQKESYRGSVNPHG